MKYDVAHRRIWFKGEILDVNDAKINILAPTSQLPICYILNSIRTFMIC